MGLNMNVNGYGKFNSGNIKKVRSNLTRRLAMITIFLLVLLLISNVSAQPFLDGHFIVIIQGDDPDTEEKEPGSQLYAIERFYFLVPYNETWVEVPVPKIANMEGMKLDHVVFVESMGYIPGDYSAYWNQDNPPIKIFKDMTDMECCVADFYAWGFPENADRNISVYTNVDTEAEFIQYFDDVKSDDVWNFSSSGLSMNPDSEYGNYISTPTIMGINITKAQLYWDVPSNETNVTISVSNDNGTSWMNFTDFKGEEINFTNPGNELIWQVNMSQDIVINNTPLLENLWINISFIPAYTELTLQLDYIIDRNSDKFEFVWDLYMDYGDGTTPHTLVYTDKDHKLEAEGIPLSYYESQTEYPTKDAYIYMSQSSGSFAPEATVTITKQVADEGFEFPWILIIFFIIIVIIVLVVLVYLLSRPKVQEPKEASEPEEPYFNEDQEAEIEGLNKKKTGLLKAIKKLDADYEEGLLDEDVYSDLKGNYKQKTIEIMKQIDALTAAAAVTPIAPEVSPEMVALIEKKQKILKGIKKLEADFQEGLLDEETYNELRADYKKKAVEIVKEIESFNKN
jgi:hypothetical protein